MAILKCKMCGGNIELSADKTFGTCEYCGSTMTFPKVDDEQRAAMFNRGNHFRRVGEFDKALAVYERIVQEDENDAEAHWCCALCRFGIEYVEDPNTLEYLPTCHRASFDSFLEDPDYLAALEHSDGITRRQYQKDAAKIAEVQRGILATSQNEDPFDVFLCYKETEEDGSRTRDSLYAQDIYYQLTEQGRRVFFSRITLEDKAGTEYEPYIFAALNSAKVMILVTTSAEHANSVWVKNEWSRFLSLMRKDCSKLLLPCYRDMDPYDLPEALSVLQSYDMSKIGFIQDLIRGVNKVLNRTKPKQTAKETVVVQQQSGHADPLLERAFMFLEDGDWAKADEFCEQVLNLEPKNALAYLGKLMAELHVNRREQLKDQPQPFDDRNSYQKALRFGDDKLKAELTGAVAHTRERNEEARREGIYGRALSCMRSQKYTEAKGLFDSIPDYKDAAAQSDTCAQKAEEARKDDIFSRAQYHIDKDTVENLEEAIQLFRSIPGWRNADQKVAYCEKRIGEIRTKEEATRREYERRAKEQQIAKQKKKEQTKKIALIFAAAFVVIVAAILFVAKVIVPNSNYKKAVALHEAGQYKEAITAFEALDGYRDSAARIEKCEAAIKDEKYAAAVELYTAGQYEEAIAAFEALNGYKDSAAQIEKCETAIKDEKYAAAVELYNASKYEDAITAFTALNGHEDSVAQIEACETAIKDRDYDAAVALYNAGKYEVAIDAFAVLNSYKDSAKQSEKCVLAIMEQAIENNQPSSFLSAERIDKYKAFLSDQKETMYAYAVMLAGNDSWSLAQKCFKECENYENAEKYYTYVTGRAAYAVSEWEAAIDSFSRIEGFTDAGIWLDDSYYQAATHGTVSLEKALEYLGRIQKHTDKSTELLETCQNLSKCTGEYTGTVKEGRKDGKRSSYTGKITLAFCLIDGVPNVEQTGGWIFSAVSVENGTDGYAFMANFNSSNGIVKCWFSANKAKEDNPGLTVIHFFSK